MMIKTSHIDISKKNQKVMQSEFLSLSPRLRNSFRRNKGSKRPKVKTEPIII